MVERIQLLASGIVPTVGWYCDEIHFSIAFLHLQLQNFSASAKQTLSPCGWGLGVRLMFQCVKYCAMLREVSRLKF